jgi:hypothetical protein
MKKICLIVMLLFSTNCLAMFCPANLKEINYGDSMTQVISLCGNPDSQGTYAEYASNESEDTDDNASAEQEEDEYDADQKIVVITKFVYGKPHPAVLVFQDGKLTARQSRDNGAIFLNENHRRILKLKEKNLLA